MKDIFNTFPALDKLTFAKETMTQSIVMLPAVLFLALFGLMTAGLIILIVDYFLQKMLKSHVVGFWDYTKDMFFPFFILGSMSVLFVTLAFVNTYYEAEQAYQSKNRDLLKVEIYKNWYVNHAKEIDEALHVKEYVYLEHEFTNSFSISDLEEEWLSEIGYKEDEFVLLVFKDAKANRHYAYVQVVEPPHDKENGTLELKDIAEFGEEYTFGQEMLYGKFYLK